MKNGEIYMLYSKNSNEFKEITKQEYLTFWREIRYCKELLAENRNKMIKCDISQDTYELRTFIILNQIGKEKGDIAIKFDTYKELQDTKELVELLKTKLK